MDELDKFIKCSRKAMSDGNFDLREWKQLFCIAYIKNENTSSIVNVQGLNCNLKLYVLLVN